LLAAAFNVLGRRRQLLKMHKQSLVIRCFYAIICLNLSVSLCVEAVIAELPSYRVTAWHFPEEALELPTDVVRIERSQIERSTARSLPDLLQTEANVFFRSTSGRISDGEISMRGFGENSGLRSLILVNGQPLNPSDMGGVNWDLVPLDSVESLEVLRGGQNVLYGDRALAGVIKIETRQAYQNHAQLNGVWGNYGYAQQSIQLAASLGNWGVRAGGTLMEVDGYREHSQAWSENANLGAQYVFESGDRLEFFLSNGESYTQFSGPIGTYEAFKQSPRSSSNLGQDQSWVTGGRATILMEADRSWGGMELSMGYDFSDTDWALSSVYGANLQTGWTLRPRFLIGEKGHRVIMGADFVYDDLEFKQYKDIARTIQRSNAFVDEGRGSPYFFAEQSLSDRLTLSGGLRYEWSRFEVENNTYVEGQIDPLISTNRGTSRTSPNPNYKNPADIDPAHSYSSQLSESGGAAELSLNYRVSDRLSAWLGYDHSYRYPVFDEIASYQGVALAQSVNSDLEAEEGDGFDFGLKYYGDKHQVFVTCHAMWMQNEIGFVEDPNTKLGLNVNVGPVNRYGADVSWAYSDASYGFSTAWAYVHTEMRAGEGRGNAVPQVPSLHVTNQLWYEPLPALRLTLIHRYVGEQYQGGDFANTSRQLDGYNVFDTRLQFEVSDNVSIYLKASNVFDVLYAEAAYFGTYYPGAGRSFSAGINCKF
jgi:iron complex outermembrane receptor protein